VSLRKLRHNQSISYTCANPHRMSVSNLTSTNYFLTYLCQNEGAEPGKYKWVEIRVNGFPRRSIVHTRNLRGFVLGLVFSYTLEVIKPWSWCIPALVTPQVTLPDFGPCKSKQVDGSASGWAERNSVVIDRARGHARHCVPRHGPSLTGCPLAP